MIDKPNAAKTLGLELGISSIKGAELTYRQGQPILEQVFDMPVDIEHTETSERASPLDLTTEGHNLYQLINKNLLVTGLNTHDVLIRPLEVKLTKLRDVDSVLSFQSEPLLPYPAEEALIDRIVLGKTQEATDLTLTVTKKDSLENHLAIWQSLNVEPEIVSCTPAALAAFSQHFYSSESPYFVLHLGLTETTCLLIEENQLIAAFSCPTHFSQLLKIQSFENIDTEISPEAKKLIDKWCLEITKVIYSLEKQIKEDVSTILLTGEGSCYTNLVDALLEKLTIQTITPKATPEFPISEAKLQKYAVSIGMALSAQPKQIDPINFRQEEFAYPDPWKRVKNPLLIYFGSVLFASLAFYILGNAYLSYEEDQIKQEYVELVAFMHKPYDKFEEEYARKFPSEDENPKELSKDVKGLSREGLTSRINQLEKAIQTQPETFPLQPRIPLVTDVLAWLRNHPQATVKDEETGLVSSLIEIENFQYTVVKRPDKNRKQEKYQVKVDLEFKSPAPKYAREFHDALIAPNDFVDPRSEVKWTASQGKYHASFFLKDQTLYTKG